MPALVDWLRQRQITEVECLTPDMSGVARGKILPADKFIAGLSDRGLRLPEAVFGQTVTGDYPDCGVVNPVTPDVFLAPDPATARVAPWRDEPTAQVIADAYYANGDVVDIAPRAVLKRVLALYAARGWRAVVAPELEFYFVSVSDNPDRPLEPPVGRSGRRETGRQAFGIEAAGEFDPIMEDVHDWCEAQRIDVGATVHEAGAAQMELNLRHGDALELADQTFLFKRTVRHAAVRHGVHATFMARPMQHQPGSAMHIHQSVVCAETGRNLFAANQGGDSGLFMAHIAGLQKFIAPAMPLFAPNPNSYRRLRRYSDAPINAHWGRDNRTVGLRVPVSNPHARRVENRVAGADVNPYLAIAASLACGYLGMVGNMKPKPRVDGDAYKLAFALPRHLQDALAKFAASKPLCEILGERFIDALTTVKDAEWDAYQSVISPWEREHLLLNV